MADIDQIIAGGAGAGTTADFSKLPGILDAFYKGRDEFAKNDLRTAFQNGVPLDANGQPDFGAMAKTFFQKGAIDQGVQAANLGLQQQNLQQNREGALYSATGQSGGVPQPPVVGPSISRNSVTIDPSKRADISSSQGGGQETPASFLQKQGIQPGYNMEVGLAAFKRNGIEPNQPFNPNDPAFSAKFGPLVQRLKGVGQVQPPQPGDNPQQPGSTAPMTPTPVATQAIQPQPQPQAQPQPQPQPAPQPQAASPFANAQAAGLIPPGVDPNRYVAGLKYRAAALPKGPAQESIQAQVNAIDKATELTQTQRDYNASHANPGIDNWAAQQEADKASAKGVAEANVKEQNDLIGAGKQASQRLATLNTLSNIVNSDKNLTLGFGADTALKVKMAMKQMGLDVGDLSGAEAIQKLNASLASEAAKSISARPAQFEFKTFLGNNPGLSLDKQGNQRVIGIFSQLAKRDVDLGRLARANRDNWDNWDSVVQQYDKQNPIHDPATGHVITTDSIVAPGPAKSGQPASLPTPKAGEIINGHIFRGGNPKNKASWDPIT